MDTLQSIDAVSDVMNTLCKRGRVTLRKNGPRWRTALPGFRVLAQRLDAAVFLQDNPSGSNGEYMIGVDEPSVAEHAAKLLTIASVACAGATANEVGSWTTSLNGNWNAGAFRFITQTVLATVNDDDDTPPRKKQRVSPWESVVLKPPDIPDSADFPEPLVTLLQIALFIRQDGVTCAGIDIDDDDGSILMTVEELNVTADEASVRRQLRFPGVLSKDSFAAVTQVMYEPTTWKDTQLLQRWRQVVESYDLVTSMFIPFSKFVEEGSFGDHPFPPNCNPDIVFYQPKVRLRPDNFFVFQEAMCGRASEAIQALLRQGYIAAMDPLALTQLADAVMVLGRVRAAVEMLETLQAVFMGMINAVPIRQHLLLGELSMLMPLLPMGLTLLATLLFLARGYRKLGEQDPASVARAVEMHERFRRPRTMSAQQWAAVLKQAISDATLRAIQAALPIPPVSDHLEFVGICMEVAKYFRLLCASEDFALARCRRVSAAEVYSMAQDLWLDDKRINWQHWPGCSALPLLGVSDNHNGLMFMAYAYARAMAEAPDATLEHIEHALSRIRFAYESRRDAMGADAPATRKAQDVMTSLEHRRAALVNTDP